VQVRHLLVGGDEILELVLGHRLLREDPFLRHLFAVEDPGRRDDRRPPLKVRVDGRDRGQVVLLPLAQEVELILAGDRGDLLARILERLRGGDGRRAGLHPDAVELALVGDVVRDDLLRIRSVTIGLLVADDLELGVREDLLGRGPPRLQDVDSGQDPQREDLAARVDVV
jgi:hypothetical protein